MKVFQLLVVLGVLFITALPIVSADQKMSDSIPCPVCKMPMTTTKTAMNVNALMVHGKKYYCCSMCAAGKAAGTYDKAHPGKVFVAEK